MRVGTNGPFGSEHCVGALIGPHDRRPVVVTRTPKLPFIESRAATSLIVTTVLVMGIGTFLPMGLLADYFKPQALPVAYFACLIGILVAYCGSVNALG
jgi:Mg2+-importing ATPase